MAHTPGTLPLPAARRLHAAARLFPIIARLLDDDRHRPDLPLLFMVYYSL